MSFAQVAVTGINKQTYLLEFSEVEAEAFVHNPPVAIRSIKINSAEAQRITKFLKNCLEQV